MSEKKHTPGQLVADENTEELPFRVYSKDTQGNVGYFLAEGDAVLFAAAPDLLEALRFFVEHPGVSQLCTFNSKAMESARAAIAKALGAQS